MRPIGESGDRDDPLADERVSDEWRTYRARIDVDEYDTRWDRLAAEGHHVHGEADLVMRFEPGDVLDAGCGAGRVAIELARRGVAVVGVDLDPDLLDRARRRTPDLRWVRADLAELDLEQTFDVVVMAGNVLPFVRRDRRASAVAGAARHVRAGGHLVVGATLAPDWPTVDDHDRWCAAAGLELVERYATWSGDPFREWADYAVHVHRRP
ncbi:MAG: class I SAM-dependent methyltransferase [Ilumatobacteraceae bacterium]